MTLWRKSEGAPLELLAAPQARAVGDEAIPRSAAQRSSRAKVRPAPARVRQPSLSSSASAISLLLLPPPQGQKRFR